VLPWPLVKQWTVLYITPEMIASMRPARSAKAPKMSSRIRAPRTNEYADRASGGACGPGGGEDHGELAMRAPDGALGEGGGHAAAGAVEESDGVVAAAVTGGGTVLPHAGQKATPDANAVPHFEQKATDILVGDEQPVDRTEVRPRSSHRRDSGAG